MRLSCASAALFCVLVQAEAQNPSPGVQSRPAFEVVSIAPSQPFNIGSIQSGQARLGTRVTPSRVNIGMASLISLIGQAYRLKSFQVFGPEWLKEARFDIQAKLPAESRAEQVPEMLQTLLEERFDFAFHREMREFSVYVLVTGKNGAKLRPVPEGYDPAPTDNRRAFTLDQFAWWLSLNLDRPVVDETQIAGEYVFDMTELTKGLLQNAVTRASRTDSSAASDPGSAVAFRTVESLGLKLEAQKRKLPVLIVDTIAKAPSEN